MSLWHTIRRRVGALLPAPLRDVLGAVNQRTFARWSIRRKYGSWFDVDWRDHFRSLSDDEWKKAYDTAWVHRANDCVEESDVERIRSALDGPGSVLDVGSGSGTLAIHLARAGYRVTGLDVSAEALRQSRQRAAKAGVTIEWREGFAENLPFPDRAFDFVTCCHTLEHVKDLGQAVSELRRVARRKIVVLVPRQRYKRYMENYHTQFFAEQSDVVNAFALPSFRCEEIDCRDHRNEFQGTAILYEGILTGTPVQRP